VKPWKVPIAQKVDQNVLSGLKRPAREGGYRNEKKAPHHENQKETKTEGTLRVTL
jgi:hypothetical protein